MPTLHPCNVHYRGVYYFDTPVMHIAGVSKFVGKYLYKFV